MGERVWLAVAAALGLVAVAAGAFGAHGLEAAGNAQGAELVATGSRYQMWHALAILACALANRCYLPALWLWAIGAVLFPFSLYGLALGAPHDLAPAYHGQLGAPRRCHRCTFLDPRKWG